MVHVKHVRLVVAAVGFALGALPFAASAAPSPCPPSNPDCVHVTPNPCSPHAVNCDLTRPQPIH